MKRKAACDAKTNQTLEWGDIVCPICMEHPHNAVILRCTSYKKGCKAYICDTSYMHSNCLDRFVEQNGGPKSWHSLPSSTHWNSSGDFFGADLDVMDGIDSFYGFGNLNPNGNDIVAFRGGMTDTDADYTDASWGRISSQTNNLGFSCRPDMSITCPLCRGSVTGWEIAVEGRKHLNMLKRSCSHDGCSFAGNYRELRQHTRNDHLGTNPVSTDPTRQQSWHRLEQQREHDDIISALRSATPEAVVLGDYVIERGDRQLNEDEEDIDRSWLDTLYILRLINSVQPESSRRLRRRRLPGAPSRPIRMPAGHSESNRLLLWGENLLGIQDDDDNIAVGDNSNETEGDHPPAS